MTEEPPLVLLDTNALMMPAQLDVDLFDELERLLGQADIAVPDVVVDELDRLERTGAPAESSAAAVGRSLLADRTRTITTDGEAADPTIGRLAEAGLPGYVVTNDAPLRDRVLDAGIPVISLRGRTKLAIIHP